VLIVNGAYGAIMVIIHALLLGVEDAVPPTSTTTIDPHAAAPSGSSSDGSVATTSLGPTVSPGSSQSHWFLQLVDLDIGWGHDLLGFDDFTCLMGGLIYGVLVVTLSGLMFNSLHSSTGGQVSLAMVSRWFVAWLNLEIALFIGLVFCKLPKLCVFQQEYLPALAMDCELLRYLYLQRVVVFLSTAGLVTWVFSSMAYLLSFGNTVIDHPQFRESMELQDAHARAAAQGQGAPFQSGGQPMMSQQSQQFRRGIVGEPTGVGSYPPGSMSRLPMSSQNARPSYSIRGNNFPRNGSSAISSASTQAETHALIRGPTTVY